MYNRSNFSKEFSGMQSQSQVNPSHKFILPIAGVLILSCCFLFALSGVFLYPTVKNKVSNLFATPQPVPEVELDPANAGGAAGGPAGGGLGDSQLKADVWNSILSSYASQKYCKDVTSVQIEVSRPPDSSGAWQEAWTVMACGQTNVLLIDFTPSPEGGTDYSVNP